jgi:uncharacterized protein YjbJ (UPF0337 family)
MIPASRRSGAIAGFFLAPSLLFHVRCHVRNQGAFMKDSTKDKTEGTVHEAKGAVKQAVGHALNKPNLAAEGTAEKVGGKIQKKAGDIEKAAGR